MRLSEVAERATERFPFLYFSMRVGSLAITFGALAAWLVTGFNIVEGAVPFIGIQWSTFATFAFFFYLLMVNFQVGGLRSLKQLQGGMKMDLIFLGRSVFHPLEARYDYPTFGEVNPFRAVVMSLLVCISALFLFESIWVPLYDYFQFGSLTWPVYFAVTSFPGVIVRNLGLFIMPLFLFWLMLDLGYGETRLKLRLDFGAIWLAILAASFWCVWIAFPHNPLQISTINAKDIIGPTAPSFNAASCYVWPSQGYFPQNTYTFYPCSLLGEHYTPPQILGFFNPDNYVHAVNVLTKFVTFGALCYPAMALVRGKP